MGIFKTLSFMKKVFTLALVALGMMAAMPSQAQIKFGVKGGLNITDMSMDSKVLDASNRTGFFIGPSVKFTLPVVGLGIDAAALYDQREAKLKVDEEENLGTDFTGNKVKQQAINIPINLRYSIGLGSLAGIYFAAGPQFGFNVGDKNFDWYKGASYKLKSSNFSVNLGAGVTLIKHIEVGFNYNIACGKTGEVTTKGVASDLVKEIGGSGKSNAWQISAAYYF